jgi:hypothetical protein
MMAEAKTIGLELQEHGCAWAPPGFDFHFLQRMWSRVRIYISGYRRLRLLQFGGDDSKMAEKPGILITRRYVL